MKTFPEDDERDRMLDGWQEAANGWGRQADSVREAAMPVSLWMLEHAGLAPGKHVLELAAGPGDTGFMAAQRIKPGGILICSDAVAAMLDVARERAQEQQIDNVEFKQLQLEWIDLPTASVDVVLVKWAVMLVFDPEAALRECRRVLKPGGQLAFSVWDLADVNPWATIPQRAMTELGHIDPPAPGGPGMFALAEPSQLRELLDNAGFFEIEIEAVAMPRRYPSINSWIGETIDLSSSFRAAWAKLDDEARRALRALMSDLGTPFVDTRDALVVPARTLAAAASA
jgi:SAM-dependent methyltransferase